MIVPSQRLLWLAGAVALPTTTIAGLYPTLATPCYAVLAACAMAAAADAIGGGRRIRKLQLRTPEFLRFTKNVPASLPVTIENRSKGGLRIRLGAVMPPGVESERVVEDTATPPGLSLLNWSCTGRARGDQVLRELHIETLSPLGLWQVREPRSVQFTFRVYPNLRDRATASLFLKTADAGMRLRRQI